MLFQEGFPTESGKGRFVPAVYTRAAEIPDHDYPFVFLTGRQLEHWHTGSMTRRALVLDALEPRPSVYIHPADLAKLGAKNGELLLIESRRGSIQAPARAANGIQRGTVIMPFSFHEAAANLLTNEALDSFAKIPEFKYCAVRITRSALGTQAA